MLCTIPLGKPLYYIRFPKLAYLLDVGSIHVVSAHECYSHNCCQLFPWTSTQLVKVFFWRKSFDEREYGIDSFRMSSLAMQAFLVHSAHSPR